MSSQQKLVLSIIDFLNKSIEDGTVKQDDREGLEIAIQCIGEAFGVDPSDSEQSERLSIKPASLQSIFDVFVKTQAKVGSRVPQVSTNPPPVKFPSAEDKAKAEKLKQAGNAQMSSKSYDIAIESYTKAITLDASNPVYYSNRAAAYASKGDHSSAVSDAEKAIEVDPSFVKAYSRLGHAQYTLGDYTAAAAAFRRGLELDPSNANLKSGLSNSEDRISTDDGPPPLIPDENFPPAQSPGSLPNAGAGLGNMADMLGGMSGGGGLPDMASMMSNPMFMQMAQNMMANGGLESLMSNPAVANMMNRVQSGGGMPPMDELLQDPTLRNLAGRFGGAGAGQ
jgi:small glutamine-rich tetratricopeptide repeat-containing protein alpha